MVAFGAPSHITRAYTQLLSYVAFDQHLKYPQSPVLSREQAIEIWRSRKCPQVADTLDYLKDYPEAVFTSSSANIDNEMYSIAIGSLRPHVSGSHWLMHLANDIGQFPDDFLQVFDQFVGSLLASERRVGALQEDTVLDSHLESTPDD